MASVWGPEGRCPNPGTSTNLQPQAASKFTKKQDSHSMYVDGTHGLQPYDLNYVKYYF